MEDTPVDGAGSGRSTRTRSAEASRRRAMLHQLRAVRNGEFRASDPIQAKVDGPIYDTVPEDEYALVALRLKEADGLGYVEDWNWSQRPVAAQAKRELHQQQSAKATSLSTAAAKTGQQISSMLTSSVFKRHGSDRAKSLALTAAEMDDVIAEFAPDEDDREERRRRIGRVIGDAKMVRSNNIGNDIAVELKNNDAEMENNVEEISGSRGS